MSDVRVFDIFIPVHVFEPLEDGPRRQEASLAYRVASRSWVGAIETLGRILGVSDKGGDSDGAPIVHKGMHWRYDDLREAHPEVFGLPASVPVTIENAPPPLVPEGFLHMVAEHTGATVEAVRRAADAAFPAHASDEAKAELAKELDELASKPPAKATVDAPAPCTDCESLRVELARVLKQKSDHSGCRRELERVRDARNTDLRHERDRLRITLDQEIPKRQALEGELCELRRRFGIGHPASAERVLDVERRVIALEKGAGSVELLRKFQWCATDVIPGGVTGTSAVGCCPSCGGYRPPQPVEREHVTAEHVRHPDRFGHRANCKLAEAIR